MRTRHLIVLSALLPLLAACASPGADSAAGPSPKPATGTVAAGPARKPTVLLAAREGSGLVRVDLGAATKVTTLVDDGYPMHVEGDRVVYGVLSEGGSEALYHDVGVVDPATGDHHMLTRGGRTMQVLRSPDGKHRYVVDSRDSAVPTSLFRTDADGGSRKVLIAEGTGFWLSNAALSPDGRTLYVARTYDEQPSTLLAVDTETGRERVVDHGTPFQLVAAVVASPDGRLLAVTVGPLGRTESGPEAHVALVPTAGGATRLLKSAADLRATAFSRDGGHVVLTHTITTWRDGYPTERDESLAFADVTTGRIERIKGTDRMFHAVSLD